MTVPIAAGAGGGAVVLILIILTACYCKRKSIHDAGMESSRKYNKDMPENEKIDFEGNTINGTARPKKEVEMESSSRALNNADEEQAKDKTDYQMFP